MESELSFVWPRGKRTLMPKIWRVNGGREEGGRQKRKRKREQKENKRQRGREGEGGERRGRIQYQSTLGNRWATRALHLLSSLEIHDKGRAMLTERDGGKCE